MTATAGQGVSDRERTIVWDGPALLAAIEAATDWLAAHADQVNALNVFPVPDGDTGTNMLLTMRAAVAEATLHNEQTAGAMAARIARGALMGARGNSGVILSQIVRGFATVIADHQALNGRDLVAALASASEMAYRAVMQPVEGTMLTVIRVAAERAAAARRASLATVLEAAVEGARDALAETPRQLAILRHAGVVDAGGQGVVYLLEGLERYAHGETTGGERPVPAASLGAAMTFLDQIDELHGEDAFGYCTNFMVIGEGIDVERVRADLAAMGQSAVIVGDETLLKVHLHTLNPGEALDYAVKLGELDQIKIDNIQLQTKALTVQRAAPVTPESGAGVPFRAVAIEPVGRQAVLAVATGDGIVAALRSMGATDVIPGGETMNPSIEDLLTSVAAALADEVIILPNDPNSILTAGQVPALTSRAVRVVPSRSVPQGLAALAAFNADADLEANVATMTRALSQVRTVKLTRAVRDAMIDAVQVTAGEIIGLVDDRLIASGRDETAVACSALDRAGLDEAELVTIFTGDGARPEQPAALQAAIERGYPHLTVEVLEGGQPHYLFVIGVE
jgi:DAK2 domain fusion protein YloV